MVISVIGSSIEVALGREPPYLFILAINALPKLLNKVTSSKLFEGLRIPWVCGGIKISNMKMMHFFSKTNKKYIYVIKVILNCFERLSGLANNYQKICVSNNANHLLEYLTQLTYRSINFSISYIQLTLKECKLSKNDWMSLICRMKSKLVTWKGWFLFLGGRLPLVNAILSTIPLYYLPIFKILEQVVDRLNKLRRAFLQMGPDSTIKGCLVR